MILYVHSEFTWAENSVGPWWLRAAYERAPPALRDQLRMVYVLHPTLSLRCVLNVVGLFCSGRLVQDKVQFVHRYRPRPRARLLVVLAR